MQVIWLGVLALLVAALAACASAPNATSPGPNGTAPAAKPGPIALVIGDSQANAGNDVPTSASWVSHGLAQAGYVPRIEGYGGTGFLKGRPQDGHHSYPESLRKGVYALPENNVDLVVVQGGGNDVKYPDGRIEAAASDTVETLKLKYPDARLAVVSPLNQSGDPASRRVEVSKILANVAEQQDAAFIDATGWVAENRLARYLYEDGLHLKPEGHDILAPVFAEALHDAGITAVAPANER
ncbi:SGNH/GDSL hydrolase family protein [Arthrobacter crystallopoietes]|uniref:SGNH/GDSL hydrolase family protein n=1 Tax=Crystallibacter crystallopoietes TaxID=37928 RepID=UPI003D1B5B74